VSGLAILVNAGGGTARRLGRDAIRALAGPDDRLEFVRPRDLSDAFAAVAAAGHGRVAVGGGDGTQSLAAACALAHDVVLAPLPLGTRNHLVRDLGLPLDPAAAVEHARTAAERRIDVGTIGDAVFVNNVSLGLYPWLVARRDRVERRLGWPRWLAMAWAAQLALRRFPRVSLTFDDGDGARAVRTPLLFVGNNRYGERAAVRLGSLEALPLGRARLDEGRLHLVTAEAVSRLEVIRVTAAALAGRERAVAGIEDLDVTRLTVNTRRRRSLRVAVDGETRRLRTPLRLAVRPGALRVPVAANGARS
jgi:diacylglycerol kinase family enzyme